MNKNIFSIIIISILLIGMMSFISADLFRFDNVKSYDVSKQQVTITNFFGVGGEIAKITLTKNTDYCLIDCSAEGTTTLYSDGILFDGVEFRNSKSSDKYFSRDYKIFVEENLTKETEVPVKYKEVCKDVINNKTEEKEKVCHQEVTATEKKEEIYSAFVEYKGEKLPAGTYRWRIEGKKGINENVDWVSTISGIKITDFAWWNTNVLHKMKVDITEPNVIDRNVTSAGGWLVNASVTFPTGRIINFSEVFVIGNSETTELEFSGQTTATNGVYITGADLFFRMNERVAKAGIGSVYVYYDCDGCSAHSYSNNYTLMQLSYETGTAPQYATWLQKAQQDVGGLPTYSNTNNWLISKQLTIAGYYSYLKTITNTNPKVLFDYYIVNAVKGGGNPTEVSEGAIIMSGTSTGLTWSPTVGNVCSPSDISNYGGGTALDCTQQTDYTITNREMTTAFLSVVPYKNVSLGFLMQARNDGITTAITWDNIILREQFDGAISQGGEESSDAIYPQFSNYWDNNGTQVGGGTGLFNVTLLNTNGTVILIYNNTNYTATNSSGNPATFNVTLVGVTNGTYPYNWSSYGNGSLMRYNISNARSYFVETQDLSPPVIVLSNQVPKNITSFNVYTLRFNASYSITDTTGVNASSVTYYSKTNSTTNEIWQYINGTQTVQGYQGLNGRVGVVISNISDNWNFLISSNLIYPSVFNLDPEVTGLEDKSIYNLDTGGKELKIRFFNLTGDAFGTFNFMANSSVGAGDLRIYYCNSSYVTGLTTSSPNCVQISNFAGTQIFNYSLSSKSQYNFVPFQINVSTNKISGIYVTPTSYFLMRGTTGSTWYFYYVTDIARPDTIQSSTALGIAWTNFSGTVNAFVSQYTPLNFTNYNYVCASDTSPLENSGCSNVTANVITQQVQPPTIPNVYSPIAQVYNGNVSINYTSSESIVGSGISYYNISLMQGAVYNKTISTNNSLNLGYIWNSVGTWDGNYTIQVQAIDNTGMSSYGYSEEFQIHNNAPIVILFIPTNLTNSSLSSVAFNCSAGTSNGFLINNVSLWLNGERNYTLNDGINNFTSLQTARTLPDGNYDWTCSADDNYNLTGWATNRTLTVDTTAPVIAITFPLNITYSAGYIFNKTVSIDLNSTATDANLQACWIYDGTTGTNNTVTCGQNLTINAEYAPYHFIFYANDTFGNENNKMVSANWRYIILQNNITYNNATTSGASETFGINLSIFNYASYMGLIPLFVYNNVNYSTTTTNTGDNKVFTSTINVPAVTAKANMTFYWLMGLVNSSGTFYYNSTPNNQSIVPVPVAPCSSTSIPMPFMNLQIADEDRGELIDGTIEIELSLYTLGTKNVISTYNNSLTYTAPNAVSICLSNSSLNYSMSYTIKYFGNSTYYPQYKTQQYGTVYYNTSQNITLLDLTTTSGGVPFVISLRGASDNKNYLVDVQRQYIPSYNFLSVESSVTDSNGNTQAHLIQGTIIYNFLVTKDGQPIATFNNYQVKCNNVLTGDCGIILSISDATATVPDFTNYGNITQLFLWDNVTRTESLTWAVTDGNVHTVTQRITQAGNQICYSVQVGTSGTILCNVPFNYGNDSLQAEVFIDGKGLVGGTNLNIGQPVGDIFGGTGVIIMLLLYSSLVMLLLSNPVLIVIGGMLGMVFGVMLFLISGGGAVNMLAAVGWFILAAILIAWQIGRRHT